MATSQTPAFQRAPTSCIAGRTTSTTPLSIPGSTSRRSSVACTPTVSRSTAAFSRTSIPWVPAYALLGARTHDVDGFARGSPLRDRVAQAAELAPPRRPSSVGDAPPCVQARGIRIPPFPRADRGNGDPEDVRDGGDREAVDAPGTADRFPPRTTCASRRAPDAPISSKDRERKGPARLADARESQVGLVADPGAGIGGFEDDRVDGLDSSARPLRAPPCAVARTGWSCSASVTVGRGTLR